MLKKFGLIVEHSKTDIFHFNRSYGNFNPPPLNLTPIGDTILWPKNTWKYLGFIFDRKLSFHQHVNFYSNKVMSTVKCMKILGSSNRGINLIQKYLLYRTCILPIALYRFNPNPNPNHIMWPNPKLHPHIISLEDIRENAKKSCHMDLRGFQNLFVIWYQSYCGTYTHQALSSKIWWKITTSSAFAPP